jgi:hypothetical protein
MIYADPVYLFSAEGAAFINLAAARIIATPNRQR